MAKTKRSVIRQATFTPDENQEVNDAAEDMMVSVSALLRWAVLTQIRAGVRPQGVLQATSVREPASLLVE